MRTTRVFELANRLATATGTRARIRQRPGGGHLVEVDLPPGLTGEAQRAVLAALAGADRYGHRFSTTAQRVWAEIDEESAP